MKAEGGKIADSRGQRAERRRRRGELKNGALMGVALRQSVRELLRLLKSSASDSGALGTYIIQCE